MTTSSPIPKSRLPEDNQHEDLKLPKPKLRLHINDLSHPATSTFLTLLPDVASTLQTALGAIVKYLYTPPSPSALDTLSAIPSKRPSFNPCVPPTRSVTVILRDFSGAAYTVGTELDDDHKEIHFSLSYIRTCEGYADPVSELVGVLTHELVHCYQHTAPPPSTSDGGGQVDIPRPPGGLIEGVADFVRLKAGLEPPHWKRPTSAKERVAKWDQGYQHTAFFLAWLEDVRVGKGAVGMLNDRLLRVGYIGEGNESEQDKATPSSQGGEKSFWKGLFGAEVSELWEEYGKYLDDLGDMGRDKSCGNWEDEIINHET